mmetsp:Transcript_130000/g.323967  ORF Transcript_130000/g.323967 Transcript_130000/m.323967 type:complete len:601 (+) Transcript_130000:49-1851(+)
MAEATVVGPLAENQVYQDGLLALQEAVGTHRLLEFPRRTNGTPMLLRQSFFHRLLSEKIQLSNFPSADIIAAQADVRHLSLAQLLRIHCDNQDVVAPTPPVERLLSCVAEHIGKRLATKLVTAAEAAAEEESEKMPFVDAAVAAEVVRQVILIYGVQGQLAHGTAASHSRWLVVAEQAKAVLHLAECELRVFDDGVQTPTYCYRSLSRAGNSMPRARRSLHWEVKLCSNPLLSDVSSGSSTLPPQRRHAGPVCARLRQFQVCGSGTGNEDTHTANEDSMASHEDVEDVCALADDFMHAQQHQLATDASAQQLGRAMEKAIAVEGERGIEHDSPAAGCSNCETAMQDVPVSQQFNTNSDGGFTTDGCSTPSVTSTGAADDANDECKEVGTCAGKCSSTDSACSEEPSPCASAFAGTASTCSSPRAHAPDNADRLSQLEALLAASEAERARLSAELAQAKAILGQKTQPCGDGDAGATEVLATDSQLVEDACGEDSSSECDAVEQCLDTDDASALQEDAEECASDDATALGAEGNLMGTSFLVNCSKDSRHQAKGQDIIAAVKRKSAKWPRVALHLKKGAAKRLLGLPKQTVVSSSRKGTST